MRQIVVVVALLAVVFASTAQAAPPRHGKSTEKSTCNGLPVAGDRRACHLAYAACAATAKKTVSSYYDGHGADLATVATRYAKSIYPSAFRPGQTGAIEGCLAALMDEYRYLYG